MLSQGYIKILLSKLKMFLKEKLRNTRMQKGEGILPFLTIVQDIQDELTTIGEAYQDIAFSFALEKCL